ncbi:MAG TPA: response regulator transcription factor [Acidimicrobiales bacterium]|nr:response regulator transcription factor [Acidimicrobiales bacterium]
MRVVVVDDDVNIRHLLSVALPLNGIEVVGHAPDGRSAMAVVARAEPDGVVLDMQMPGWNGLETLRHIRRAFPETRVVLYTSEPEEVASAAARLGAEAVVGKDQVRTGLVEALLSA